MVGMSGKSNEPRGGTSGNIQHSKKLQSGSSHTKTQVSSHITQHQVLPTLLRLLCAVARLQHSLVSALKGYDLYYHT